MPTAVFGAAPVQDTTKTVRDTLAIAEVQITTGYQTVSKERFVGAASQLDSAAFHRRTGVGILARLDGTLPGLVFDKKSGGANRIQIRGISTLGGPLQEARLREPLIIVDNFPFAGDLDAINADDVASVTVLKDAAAASIWGARAGNGVIVITTKSGRLHQPLRITTRSSVSIQEKPDLYYYTRMGSADFVEVERFLYAAGYYQRALANSTSPYDWPMVSQVVELLHQRDLGADPTETDARIDDWARSDSRVDLDRHWYQRTVGQQHYLDFSGGGANYTYSVSGSYRQTGSNVQHDKGAQAYTLNARNSFRPSDRLTVESTVNFSTSADRGAEGLLPSRMHPYTKLADEQGQPLAVYHTYRMGYLDTVGGGRLLDWYYRPLEEVRLADNLAGQQQLVVNVGLSYQVAKWLRAEARMQYLRQQAATRNHYSVDTWKARDLVNRFTNLHEATDRLRYPVPMGGQLSLFDSRGTGYDYRFQLHADHAWNDDHRFSGLLGAERTERSGLSYRNLLYGYNDAYGTYATQLDHQTQYRLINTRSSRSAIPNGTDYREAALDRSISFLANGSYTYKQRYTVYGSARRDGANVFGVATNNRWKPLWSVGGSWEVSKEGFRLPAAVDYLRLRATYGYTGNTNNRLSGQSTIGYLTSTLVTFNDDPRAQIQNPPNPGLRWEQVEMVNVGLDFRLFGDRLSGDLNLFHKQSTDLIAAVPFDPTSGVASYAVNSASLEGNGYELVLQSRNIRQDAFRWETGFNISYAKMVVTELYNGGFRASDFINYGLQPGVGKVAYGLSSYRWGGLDPETGDPQGYLGGTPSKDYTAIFNDSVDNQVFHGSGIPLYTGYLSNTVTWKRLSVSANLTYRLNFFFRQSTLHYGSLFNGTNLHADYARRWQQPGDEAFTTVPSMRYPVPAAVTQRDNLYAGAEIHVKRGDNLRLQDIRLAWQLDAIALGRYRLRNMQVFVYGNDLNVILLKAYPGRLDADYSGGNNATTAPTPTSWSMGINLGL